MFLIIINVENGCAAQYFAYIFIFIWINWWIESLKEQHLLLIYIL